MTPVCAAAIATGTLQDRHRIPSMNWWWRDEKRYVEAATYVVEVNGQPYSKHDWHWRVLVAHRFGHAAAVPATHGMLKQLDQASIDGELALRGVRAGRAEVQPMWGRPESVRREFRKLRAL